jgi:hypothetical protein
MEEAGSTFLASLPVSTIKQLGIEERFFELYGGNGNTGIVAFVLPDKFIPAARDLRIRMEEASSGK